GPSSAQRGERVPARTEVRGVLKAVDVAAGTLTVSGSEGRQAAAEKTYPVAKDVEVALGAEAGRLGLFKAGKLADLAPGATVTLRLTVDQKQAQGVLAEGPSVFGVVKTVDAGNHSITVVQGPGRGGEAGEERTLEVARDAQVVLDDGKGRRL